MELSERGAQQLQGEMEVGLVHSIKRPTRHSRNNLNKPNKSNNISNTNVRKMHVKIQAKIVNKIQIIQRKQIYIRQLSL